MAELKKKAAKKRAAPDVKKSDRVKIGKGMTIKRGEEKRLEKKPGGSNVGEYPNVRKSSFCGPSGGSPAGSYPVNTKARGKSALKLAHNAPNPGGIKSCVYKKFPGLKKKK
jgi:hypothetical protein